MPHVTLIAFHRCAASGIFGAIDAFAIANRWHRQMRPCSDDGTVLFRWDIASIDGEPVQVEGGTTIVPHFSIHGVGATDVILIPGFLPPLDFLDKMPDELTNWIRRRHQANVMIGASCTGTLLLAETGLLDGRTATTNLLFSRYFKKRYPEVRLKPERIVTEDNGLLCSGSTTAFMDLCLHLIEKFGSQELAALCAKSLLMAPRQSQSPYFIFDHQKDHNDGTVKKAQCYMEERFTDPISLEALATGLAISPRHFVRRFKNATGDSPLVYLQRIRIEAAKQKLEKTMHAIDEITRQVGYEDPNSFRKLFKKTTGLSPREYRNRFARRPKPVPAG